MKASIFAFLMMLAMMLQESTAADISLTSQTVVGNILHEHMAAYVVGLLLLIAAIMI